MVVVFVLFCLLFSTTTSSSNLKEQPLETIEQRLHHEEKSLLHQQEGLTTLGGSKTLVIYSGPTDAYNLELFQKPTYSGRSKLYHDNFRFFLRNAIFEAVEGVDFVFVLTESAMRSYSNVVSYLTNLSKTQFRFRTRKNVCYDMESYFRTLKEIDISPYQDFIFLNCGILGPFMPDPYRVAGFSWPLLFTSYLSEKVKLVGLSINCVGVPGKGPQMHVQSMLWATDRVGLSLILKEGCLYDCHAIGTRHSSFYNIVYYYELCLTRAIIKGGFQVQAVNSIQSSISNWKLDSPILEENCSDYWFPERQLNGRTFHPLETIFFKVTRFSTEEVSHFTAAQLNYNHPFPSSLNDEISLTFEKKSGGRLVSSFFQMIREEKDEKENTKERDGNEPLPKVDEISTAPPHKKTFFSWLGGLLGFHPKERKANSFTLQRNERRAGGNMPWQQRVRTTRRKI